METTKLREMITSAGAEFIGVFGDRIRFCDSDTGAVLSLWVFACTPENVALTLKDCREKVLDFAPLEPTEQVR